VRGPKSLTMVCTAVGQIILPSAPSTFPVLDEFVEPPAAASVSASRPVAGASLTPLPLWMPSPS